jgi:hypothetical protein
MSERTAAPTPAHPGLLRTSLDLLLQRTKLGGWVRLGLLAFGLSGFWFLLVAATGFPGELPASWQETLPPPAFTLVNILVPFFHPQVLVLFLPVMAGILIGVFLTALYISDLFELESFWIAIRYLVASLFGLAYPTLRIDSGDLDELESINTQNPLMRIGGPGHLRVHLGYAAVFESAQGLPRVYGTRAASHEMREMFLDGFERLRGVVDLRDQIGKAEQVQTVTRDGIEVSARDVQMLFRVYGGGQDRSLHNPYPFTEAGVRRLVYGQPVHEDGQRKWVDELPDLIRGEIRKFVARHSIEEFLALQPYRMLDQDTPPTEAPAGFDQGAAFQIPRRQLTERFHTPELRRKLQQLGLELAWVGVGTWEVRDDPGGSAASTGPGDTLMATWREMQRAKLLSSPDYQARQHDRRFRETTAEFLTDILRTWRHGRLPRKFRCFETLSAFHHAFAGMLRSLEGDPTLSPPPDMAQVIDHLGGLLRSTEIGEGES